MVVVEMVAGDARKTFCLHNIFTVFAHFHGWCNWVALIIDSWYKLHLDALWVSTFILAPVDLVVLGASEHGLRFSHQSWDLLLPGNWRFTWGHRDRFIGENHLEAFQHAVIPMCLSQILEVCDSRHWSDQKSDIGFILFLNHFVNYSELDSFFSFHIVRNMDPTIFGCAFVSLIMSQRIFLVVSPKNV